MVCETTMIASASFGLNASLKKMRITNNWPFIPFLNFGEVMHDLCVCWYQSLTTSGAQVMPSYILYGHDIPLCMDRAVLVVMLWS